ncbi:hypothetical protein PAXINDRAFT_96055 [Paxillus involutus ATCC 200175]|nr:hypothetical protein PAXINDRAFT_96055 [Paxillus involutus ATCC 200175]
MSLASDDVSQSPDLDWRNHQKSHRVRRIPCGRCDAVIEHESRAHWNVVSKLVNWHWEACPGKPHGQPARIPTVTRPPTPPPLAPAPAPLIPSPLAPPSQPCPSRLCTDLQVASRHAWVGPGPGWERKRKTENQRKLELEEDEYTSDVTATSVICVGCHKPISLDKRSRYYPGLWLKHRGKCPDIEKLERARGGWSPLLYNGNARPPSGVVDSSFQPQDGLANGVGRDEEMSDLSRGDSESSEMYQDTAARGSQPSEDNLSSEDEDEDELHVPFPTLNSAYYHRQRNSDEWIYRYATKDEISTNLYRTQSA